VTKVKKSFMTMNTERTVLLPQPLTKHARTRSEQRVGTSCNQGKQGYFKDRYLDCLHCRSLLAKQSATATCDSHIIILALATLGDSTQIGSFLFMSCRPRWPRKVRKVCIVCAISGIITLNFPNVNTALGSFYSGN
jgi:hypothetical protein